MQILSQVRTCARVLCFAALTAVFVACSGSLPAEDATGATEQASISGWSGFMVTGSNPAQCLTLNANGTFSTAACSNSNGNQNFGLVASAADQAAGIAANALTSNQGLYLKSNTAVCLGYTVGNSAAQDVNCAASNDAHNDVQYLSHAIYGMHNGLCLSTSATPTWVNCVSSVAITAWSPAGMTCAFDVSQGASGTHYLEGSSSVVLAQPTAGVDIDGVAVARNPQQLWCVVENTIVGSTPGTVAVEAGACSANSGSWMVPIIDGARHINDILIQSSPTGMHLQRQTFAGVTDGDVQFTAFTSPSYFQNPANTNQPELWVTQSLPTTLTNAVHLHCNSSL